MITIHLRFLTAFMLASIRVTVFLVFCPSFSNRALSKRAKAMLRAGLGSAYVQRIGLVAQTDFFVVECVVRAFIGFSIALMMRIILAAIQMANSLLDLEDGFTMAQTFDPSTITNQAAFGRVYELTAIVLLFVTNRCQLLIMGLARSFTTMPPGIMFDTLSYAKRLIYRFAELTVSALETAGPLLLVLFLTDMGMGLLTKVAPAMSAFTFGFSLKIMVIAFFVPAIMVALPQLVVKLVGVAVESWTGVIL